MWHVGQECPERNHEPYLDVAGDFPDRVRECLPPKIRLGSREQHCTPATQGIDVCLCSEQGVLRPLDRASNAIYKLNLRSYSLVIEEFLTVEARELLHTPRLSKGVQRDARRLRRVIPACERGHEHRSPELRSPLHV